MKVSVLIAAYNADKWIGRCLESIINQTYDTLEIIVINDGSTDDTGSILHFYANRDNRIKVYDQKNSGIYLTRRTSVMKAVGDAIFFCDADDYLELNALELLVRHMQRTNADIVIANHYQVTNGKKRIIKNKLPENQIKKELLKSLFKNDIKGYCWGKLYRKQLLKELQNHKPINYGEDVLANLLIFLNNKIKVVVEERPLYYYITHKNSLISSRDKNLVETRYEYLEMAEEFLRESGELEKVVNEFSAYKCRNWIVYSRGGGKLAKDKDFRKKFYRENYGTYAKKVLHLHHNLEMVTYTINNKAGRLLSGAMKKIQAIFYSTIL